MGFQASSWDLVPTSPRVVVTSPMSHTLTHYLWGSSIVTMAKWSLVSPATVPGACPPGVGSASSGRGNRRSRALAVPWPRLCVRLALAHFTPAGGPGLKSFWCRSPKHTADGGRGNSEPTWAHLPPCRAFCEAAMGHLPQ